MLRVLEHHHGLSPAEALDTAVAQRDRVMCLFLRARDHLAASGSPQLRRYLESLTSFIRAAQDWGISSRRYTTPDDPAELPTTFRDTPTDDSAEPLDIPAIAWWWDVVPDEPAPVLPQRAQPRDGDTAIGVAHRPVTERLAAAGHRRRSCA